MGNVFVVTDHPRSHVRSILKPDAVVGREEGAAAPLVTAAEAS
jgi:hypothetical protein